MKWPWDKREPCSDDAELARKEAERALLDAHNFGRRAEEAAERYEKTKRRNHIAEAIETVIRPPRRADQ